MRTANLIPFFIEAPSKEELMRRMLENNVVNGAYHEYFDIQKDGKNWVAWYYKRVELKGKVVNGS